MRTYQTKANQGGLPDSITAEKLGAGEANSFLTELTGSVSSSGQTPAPADGTSEVTDQLGKALAIYGGGGAEYMVDTGAVNAYVLNPVSPKKATPSYFDGMTVSFKPGNDNTGASTVNVASLGVKSITDIDGVALTGGEITKTVTIRFNLSSDRFEIVSSIATTSILNGGIIDGFILSNGTDTDHDIDLTGGSAALTDGSGLKMFSDGAPPTKQIDANWAEGNNAGGFPSGLTLSADTEYNFFLIGKDDGTIDAGFDTDDAATNLLSDATGYTWYRRILSVFTDGSSNILSFTQKDDYVTYDGDIVDVNDNTGTRGTYEIGTVTVPPDMIARLNVIGSLDTASQNAVNCRPVGSSSLATISDNDSEGAATYRAGAQAHVQVDSNSQVEYTVSGIDGTWANVTIRTIGWIDDRGRNQ